MPANFYPGQTDYLRKLNALALAKDIVDIPVNVAAAAASAAAAERAASGTSAAVANASAAAASAAAAFASFDVRYLGAMSFAPDQDNNGSALVNGACYWDTVLNGGCLRVWQGTQWVTVPANVASAVRSVPSTGVLATNVQAALNELDTKKAASAGLARVATSGAKADVGLGNVDNTSDASKPVSIAQADALALKAPLSALAAKANADSLGMRNRLINGDMRIAQRGTSGSTATSAFSVDRWILYASGAAIHWSRQLTSSSNAQDYAFYALSWNGSAGNTGLIMLQRIESTNCADMAGRTVTLSFWFYQTTGVTQNVTPALAYSGGAADSWTSQTGIPALDAATAVQSGVWTKVVNRYAVPAAAVTGLCVYPWGASITFGAGSVGYVSKVQLEVGTVATPFDKRAGSTELGLCRHYYANDAYGQNVVVGNGQAFTTGTAYILVPMKGAMRAPPTIIVSGSLARLGGELVGAPFAVGYGPSGIFFNVAWSSTPFAAGDAVLLAATGSFTVTRDAEL